MQAQAMARVGEVEAWPLAHGMTFLNHGSFGSCPKPVLAEQARLRQLLEEQPVDFMVRRLEGMLDQSKETLAQFIGADSESLAFVSNATSGVNTVLRSLNFDPEDELLTTDHAYNACSNALGYVAERAGARIRVAPIPLPLKDPLEICEHIEKCISSRTRLLLVDHITSPTALVFPIKEVVARMRERGILTLVDGAHAPGMIDLNLRDLEADFYTGNCHKWLCAPKGAGFLHVHPEHRPIIRPLAISHGANATRQDRSRFTMEFDWTGTADPTAWLCVGTAIKWMAGQMPGGWKAIMQRNHTLVTQASEQLQSRLGYRCLAPDSMLGAMASVQIPDTNMPIPESTPLYSDSLQDKLWSEHQIEVPIVPWPHHPRRLLRISAQLYNQSSDYQKLIEVLEQHGPKPQ